MIKKFDLSRVRVMEFFQVMTNIKAFLEKENLQELGLQKAKESFDEKYAAFDEALKPLHKSEITAKLQEQDAKRDEALVGLLAHCRAFSTFPEEAKRTAAGQLLAQIEKYGKNLQNKPLQEETGILINLLQDLASQEMAQALETIGAMPWVEVLKSANQSFVALHNERTEEQGAVLVGKTKETRTALAEAFKTMVKSINSLAFINGEEKYQNLANAINEEVKNARK